MEAEKSHYLLPASWQPRKTSGVVPTQTQRPENHERWCSRTGEGGYPSPSREQTHLPPPFCSIQVRSGLDDTHPPWWGPSALLGLPIQMPISYRNANTPRNNIVWAIWAPLSPVKLTCKTNHGSQARPTCLPPKPLGLVCPSLLRGRGQFYGGTSTGPACW